jgi:2-polyprenyl-3-methyl-5-hydroxy-6-metoxy-1,4-benzoquinol methylase
MKRQHVIDKVSSWYKTAGFYQRLVGLDIRTIQPYLTGRSLLEIGPADGAMTQFLTRKFSELTLVEPSKTYAALLRKKFPAADIRQTVIEHFTTEKIFDTIIMAHVLEHVGQPVSILKRVKKLMQRTSQLILIVPNANSLHRHLGVAMGLIPRITALNAYDTKLGHRRVYTRKLLQKHIREAGLKVKSYGGIMLKPLSNNQMESWDKKIIEGLYLTGKTFPDLCAELYFVCTL